MPMQGRVPGSIRTYISGLSYMYKIHGLEDVNKSFTVTKMLMEGAARQTRKLDTRAPISINSTSTRETLCFKLQGSSLQGGFLLCIFRFLAGR